MKEELIALREEIQRDRLETLRTMNEGFDRVCDKLENHEVRIVGVENTQKLINWGIGTSLTASVGAFFTWLVGK